MKFWSCLKEMGMQNKESTIERELHGFYEYCKENGFTRQEMDEICKPLYKIIQKQRLIRAARFLTAVALLLTTVYFLAQTETVSWHTSAIGRITMIKILPLWNWKPMVGQKCLIDFDREPIPKQLDCAFCESLTGISTATNLNDDLKTDTPVIVNWISKPDGIDVTSDRKLLESYPCKLSSNIISAPTELRNLIARTQKYAKWFYHFQNCELDATKAFRVHVPRPDFLPDELSPIQYSWLLASSDYNVTKYKPVKLVEKITVFGQIDGSNYVRLRPRLNCIGECSVLHVLLGQGQALVFTAFYDLEYKPFETGFNLAVILETN